jgi:hypothetical protein
VLSLHITWFESEDGASVNKKDAKMIEKWIVKNAGNIHEIFHLVQEYEMEAVKIIEGTQEKEKGRTKINSYDILFISNIILIVSCEETQDVEGSGLTRKINYLGLIEIPCGEEEER